MSEKYTIVDGIQIVYSGYFSMRKVYKLILNWFDIKGYVPVELKNIEQVTEKGRCIEMELLPFRKFNDYAKSVIRIIIIATNLKEKTVTIGNFEELVNDGNIQIVLDGILETDYAKRWKSKPLFLFLRTFVDKYIYRSEYYRFQNKVYEETLQLHDELKSYLNLNKFT